MAFGNEDLIRIEGASKDPEEACLNDTFETVNLQTPNGVDRRQKLPWQAYSTVLGGIIYMTVSSSIRILMKERALIICLVVTGISIYNGEHFTLHCFLLSSGGQGDVGDIAFSLSCEHMYHSIRCPAGADVGP